MKLPGQDTLVEAVYKNAFFSECHLSLRVKMEAYNDEARQNVWVTAMTPLNIEQECAQLAAAIAAFQ
jgi:hypothetical protein